MIHLTVDTAAPPRFRVLYKTGAWNTTGSATSDVAWKIAPPYTQQGPNSGVEVIRITRSCLPGIGECKLRCNYGRMLGKLGDTQTRAKAFTADAFLTDVQDWPKAANGGTNVLDLHDAFIRVQVAATATTWQTVWVGRVVAQEEAPIGGASVPMGERIYSAVDLLYACTSDRSIWNHCFSSAASSGTIRASCVGHPGYNSKSGTQAAIGNKSIDQSTVDGMAIDCHTYVGVGSTWSDTLAVNNALALSRKTGDPKLSMELGNPSGGYAGVNAWDVAENEMAWSFINRVCDRKRGRGVVWLNWTDDTSASVNALTVSIDVCPIFKDDTSYTDTSGGTVNLYGAATNSRSITVDIIGDQRLTPGSFMSMIPDKSTYDQVIVEGEPIQVLVTLSPYDSSLEQSWTAADVTAWAALSPAARTGDRWRPLYQKFQLPRAFTGQVKDGNNGTARSAFWKIDSLTTIVEDSTGAYTSPLGVKILPDLPILEGYIYTAAAPAKASGSTTITETAIPDRKPALVLVRDATGDTWTPGDDASNGLSLRLPNDGLWISAAGEGESGSRTIETYGINRIAITVALELPHRVRFVSISGGDRVLRISAPEHHLWLATQGAIYDFAAGTPLRAACGALATPGILRDDRDALARIGTMALAYYGAHTGGRRTASWSLRACGLSGSFRTSHDGLDATVDYPRLGYFVHTIDAGGTTWAINTNITSIAYDNISQETTWETDFQHLDFI